VFCECRHVQTGVLRGLLALNQLVYNFFVIQTELSKLKQRCWAYFRISIHDRGNFFFVTSKLCSFLGERFHFNLNFWGLLTCLGFLLFYLDQLRKVGIKDAVYMLFQWLQQFRVLKVLSILLDVFEHFVQAVQVTLALCWSLLHLEIFLHLRCFVCAFSK